MRPVWKGVIRVDTFEIPAKLYSAMNPNTIRLNKFHEPCLSRISHEKKCPVHGPIPANEIISGFLIAEHEFVQLDDADFASIETGSENQLELNEFINDTDFDPLLIYKSYYLVPDGSLAKEKYSYFRHALKRLEKVGITRLTLGRKEYLAALWCRGTVVIFSLLYYHHEINSIAELDSLKGQPRVKQKEVAVYENIINNRTKRFRHAKFKDGFHKQLDFIIKEKIQQNPQAVFTCLPTKKSVPQRKGMSKIQSAEKLPFTGTD